MNYKIILGIIFILLLVSFIGIDYIDNSVSDRESKNGEYHGPVPIGYDLKHFRNTGETILEGIN